MTLIISAAVGDYLIQVSDRRLTKNRRLEDDEANKAVVFCNRASFAYTGLASIGSHATDEWLVRCLINAKTESLSKALEYVAAQASRCFQSMRYSRQLKRHAFVGIGWTRLPGESFLAPILFSVSNALGTDFSWLDQAQDQFRVNYTIGPQARSYNVISAGQNLTLAEMRRLRRRIRQCFERDTGPDPVVKLLAHEIRRIAQSNVTVGKSLMVVCLPKQAVLSQPKMFLTDLAQTSPMIQTTPSFYYLGNSADVQTSFGPNTACNGQGFRNVKLEKLNSSGSDASIECTIVLPE
jgi:hypothetical protein